MDPSVFILAVSSSNRHNYGRLQSSGCHCCLNLWTKYSIRTITDDPLRYHVHPVKLHSYLHVEQIWPEMDPHHWSAVYHRWGMGTPDYHFHAWLWNRLYRISFGGIWASLLCQLSQQDCKYLV